MFITLNWRPNDTSYWAICRFRIKYIRDYLPYGDGSVLYLKNSKSPASIRETPDEIDALIASEKYKQKRERIVFQALKGIMSSPGCVIDEQYAAELASRAEKFADSVMAALDAQEGTE